MYVCVLYVSYIYENFKFTYIGTILEVDSMLKTFTLSIYVRMYVCICMYSICMYTYVFVCMYVCIYVCMYVFVYMAAHGADAVQSNVSYSLYATMYVSTI